MMRSTNYCTPIVDSYFARTFNWVEIYTVDIFSINGTFSGFEHEMDDVVGQRGRWVLDLVVTDYDKNMFFSWSNGQNKLTHVKN